MLWDRSTKIRGSAGVGLRKKAHRLGEEVKLGTMRRTTRKPLRSAFWASGMWNRSEMTMGCRWADLGRKRQDPTASWLRGHRLRLLLT